MSRETSFLALCTLRVVFQEGRGSGYFGGGCECKTLLGRQEQIEHTAQPAAKYPEKNSAMEAL